MATTALDTELDNHEAPENTMKEVDRRLDNDKDYDDYDFYWLQNDWDKGTDWCIGSKDYYVYLQKCNFGYDKDYAYKAGYDYHDPYGQLWYQDDYGLIHSKKNKYYCWERQNGSKIKLAYCDYYNKDQIFKFEEVKVKRGYGYEYYDSSHAYDYRYWITHGYKKCVTHSGNSPDEGDHMQTKYCKNTRRFRYEKHYYYKKDPEPYYPKEYEPKDHYEKEPEPYYSQEYDSEDQHYYEPEPYYSQESNESPDHY